MACSHASGHQDCPTAPQESADVGGRIQQRFAATAADPEGRVHRRLPRSWRREPAFVQRRRMREELAALAARQGGLVTRAQAMDAGYRAPELRALTGVGGQWVTVRRGVYAERDWWNTLDPFAGPALARAWAAHLAIGVDHVMSHDSAAHAWGLPVVLTRSNLVHITRPGVWGSRTEHGIKHHLAMKFPAPVR